MLRFWLTVFSLITSAHAQPPRCQIPDFSKGRQAPASGTGVARTGLRCDNGRWPLWTKAVGGQASGAGVPPVGRVILLEKKSARVRVAVWTESKIQEGWLEAAAFIDQVGCNFKDQKFRVGVDAFLDDAGLALELSNASRKAYAIGFNRALDRASFQLQSLRWRLTPRTLESLAQKMERSLVKTESNRVRRLKVLRELIDSLDILSPEYKKSTLLIPISVAWFKSDPDLWKYFQKHFLGGGFDIKFGGGGSGEGISQARSSGWDDFDQYIETWLKLDQYIQTQASAEVRASPEARWLREQAARKFAGDEHFIFLHPATWDEPVQPQGWADYIGVDQSIGGMPVSKLFSVLMHEINVNTAGAFFMPNDTHLPAENSYSLWDCVRQHGTKSLGTDSRVTSAFFAVQPWMSTLYLLLELDLLQQSL